MAWPAFVCAGFQKCGTTTLYEILKQHPEVALCRDVKEPMYYRIKGVRALGGKRYYQKRYFGHIEEGDRRVLGEVNAGLTFGGCAECVARDYPRDTKFVFMMRNPVDRCYSAYRYFLARGFLPARTVRDDAERGHAAAFDAYVHEILDDEDRRGQVMDKRLKYLVFSQSEYVACISEYLERFPKRNMHFVFFEDFIADQHASCRELYRFLGISDCDGVDYGRHDNNTKERATNPIWARVFWAVKGVNYFFRDILAMEHWWPAAYRQYRRLYEWCRRHTLSEDDDRSKMLPETRAYLEDYYRPMVRDLEKIAGRDLSGVWY